jgi:membrane protein
MIFICGALVLASVCFTTSAVGSDHLAATPQSVVLRIVALPVTMLLIFLMYWLLPNIKIPMGRLLPSAAAVAVLLQISEYLNLLTWPWLRDKLRADVPPFVQSITIIFWAFLPRSLFLRALNGPRA